MAYWITTFGSTSLSMVSPVQDTGPGAAELGLVTLPGGGVHDPHGADGAPVRLPYRLVIEADVVGADMAAMRTALYGLRALQGQRDQLYRTPDDGALDSEWCWARLENLRIRRRAENLLNQPVTLEFAVLSHPWSGADQTIDTVLDVTPKSIVCANDGNARVTDIVVSVTARTSAITELEVVADTPTGWMQWAWSGTLAVGSKLEVDCGAQTVRVDGVDDYGAWERNALHNVSEWLRFDPGNTTVTAERTGGGADTEIEIAYCDGWA